MRSKHILRANGKPCSATTTRLGAARGFWGLLLLVLAGCATAPPAVSPAPEPVPESVASAAVLMERASRAGADRAAELYLQAAWAFLEAGDPAGADVAYQTLEPGWLDEDTLPGYRLLSAAMALHHGDVETARATIDRLPVALLHSPRAQRIVSALCEAEADYSCALRALVSAAGDDPSDNEQVWRLLGASLTLADLASAPEASATGRTHLAGWRALQKAVIVPFSVEESRTAVRRWIDAHPEHPGAMIPPSAVTDLLESDSRQRRIALLLPLSGPLSRAGEAVRDGFLAASFHAQASSRITVSIYDSAKEPLPVVYERILADGAELLIGPLQKSAVTELAALNPELPILALNYLDATDAPAGAFSQFGLAIEDEAASIAARLQRDGIERALLFHNYEDWSLRARRALSDVPALSLTVQPFTDLRTITEAVGTAMYVQSSQTRHEELERLLNAKLEFLPRAREDVDAVVALVNNTEANALVPALKFHFADQLPVYASSQTTRSIRSGQLSELNGFHVSELPYFLSGDAIYEALAAPFRLADNPFASLMALGSDAFRVGERLDGGRGTLLLLGSTGLLRQHADGRITRELDWGLISGGRVAADRTIPRTDRGTAVVGAGD